MTILSPPKMDFPAEMREPAPPSAINRRAADFLRTITLRFEASDILRLGSIFLISMGALELCGWLFHWTALLRFIPGAPFISFDTAFGFIPAGLALLAASRDALRLSRWLGAFLLVFGAVYLTAALRSGYFSLHSFFPAVTAAVTSPLPVGSVRMAGATAAVFVMLGILLILLGSLRPSRLALNVAMFVASAVLSLGLLGMLTSVTRIADQHTWISFLAKMALPTAISICVAGVSMGTLCWVRTDESGPRFQSAAASFTLIGLMLLFVGASFLAITNADIERESRRHLIATARQKSLTQSILDSVRRSETGQRGFLLIGSEAYLQDYELGLRAVSADLQELHSFPYGDHRSDTFRTLIGRKLAELASTIDLARAGKRDKALAIVKSGQGLLLMARIDAESAKLITAMESQRLQRRDVYDETLRITQKTVVWSYGIAFLMIGLGLGVLRAEISRRARVEAELRKRTSEIAERTAELEAANKELEVFAYAASHDLKAPLHAVQNTAQWLEEDLAEHLTGETREHFSMLQGRVKRMEKLLDDLLEYARIGRASDNRYAETVRGDVVMEDVLALTFRQGFSVVVSPGFSNIEVSRMPLQQIMMNLVGNAIKHHDKQTGSIAVSVSHDGNFYDFAVRDDGPGIREQFQARIFEMFRTLRPRDQVEGSGIGLAMVRKHIEVAGGMLQLDSAEGQGSTFRFTLPKMTEMKSRSRINRPAALSKSQPNAH